MIKIKSFPRKPLQRQAAESAMIRKYDKDPNIQLINNKMEMKNVHEKAMN